MSFPKHTLLSCLAAILLPVSPTVHAQSVTNFAATNLEIGGGFGRRLVNNGELGLLEGKVNIRTNGVITGRLFERFFASASFRSRVSPFTILTGSRVFSDKIVTSTTTNVCVSTNRYLPAGAPERSWQTSVSTNITIVRSSSSDFRIDFGNGYFAKGRAYEDFKKSEYRNNDGRLQTTHREVGLDGAVFKGSGEFIGPFSASTEYCP
jgi:hypothetical protein